jgi:hypothetical protein|tara:strand:- start:459 stop:641 length:183 start_codon:yes stop_codon:yes gene_type:complete
MDKQINGGFLKREPSRLKDAIDRQIGMCALAQLTDREDLLEVSKKRLAKLIDQIPNDLMV